eukprot:scaffold7453_cov67-Phaeocystis_antarctica.AAC.1
MHRLDPRAVRPLRGWVQTLSPPLGMLTGGETDLWYHIPSPRIHPPGPFRGATGARAATTKILECLLPPCARI